MRFLKMLVTALAVPAAVLASPFQGFSASHLTNSHNGALESFATHRAELISQATDFTNTVLKNGFTVQLSESCQNALMGFADKQEQFTKCSTAMNSIDDATDQQSFKDYCGSGCSGLFNSVIDTMMNNCQEDFGSMGGASSFAQYQQIFKALEGLCVQKNGEYCYPKFMANQKEMQAAYSSAISSNNHFATVSDANINIMCSDCTFAVIQTFAGLGLFTGSNAQLGNYANVLKQLCVKDRSGAYCYNKILPAMSRLSQDQPKDEDYPVMCDPCFRQLAGAITDRSARSQADKALGMLTPLCRKDSAGDACISRVPLFMNWTESVDRASNPCGRNTSAPTCGVQACKDDRQNLINKLGCCFDLFVAMHNAEEKPENRWSPAQVSTVMCGLSASGTGCAAAKALVKRLAFGNVKYSWYTANKATFDDNVCTDVARAAGLARSQCNVTSAVPSSVVGKFYLQASAAGTVITTTIQPDSDADAATIDTAIANGDFSTTASSVPDSGKVDPTKSTSPSVGGDAAGVIASMTVMFGAILLAVIMQQVA